MCKAYTKRLSIRSVACFMGLLISGGVFAAAQDIADSPLFLKVDIKPNIIMAIDDSGSMDSEVLMPTNDGAVWWKGADNSLPTNCPRGFVGCNINDAPEAGAINFNLRGAAEDRYDFNDNDNAVISPSNIWKKFVYLFPNGADQGGSAAQGIRVYEDRDNAHYAIPPVAQYAWVRSHQYNAAYFDPAVTYEPWADYEHVTNGDQTFDNASITAARTDPINGNSTFDLTQDRVGSDAVNPTSACNASTSANGNFVGHTFKLYDGMIINKDTCWNPDFGGTGNTWEERLTDLTVTGVFTRNNDQGNEITSEANGADVLIRYFPATFYVKALSDLPADFGYRTTAVPTTGFQPDGVTVMKGIEIKPANFGDGSNNNPEYLAAIQNFANWFTYYRKRHLAVRAGIGHSFKDLKRMRVGHFYINPLGNVTMNDIDTVEGRSNFYSNVYATVNRGGTPNRQALDHCGRLFERRPGGNDANNDGDFNDVGDTLSGDPIIQYSCQQNFAILFTDGYSTLNTGSGVNNADGNNGRPFDDTFSNTIADIAMHYYESLDWNGMVGEDTDLDTDTDGDPIVGGKVPTPAECDVPSPPLRFDCEKDPHMVTFGVTLGQQGRIFGITDADGNLNNETKDPYTHHPVWPNPNSERDPSQVDDLWHATVNSRGELLNAKTPQKISTELREVLNEIIRRTATGSSVALNSGFLREGTDIYLATFTSGAWSGELQAIPVSLGNDENDDCHSQPQGTLCDARWFASEELPTNATSRKIITWNPSSNVGIPFRHFNLDAAQKSALDANSTTSENILKYIRGDQSLEETDFRKREKRLGDMIHSDPVFVKVPPFRYSFGDYAGYRNTKSGRKPMIYIGANDGMLHGFNAETGAEEIAYVPNAVIPNLKELTKLTGFSHKFFVDGSPTVGDVQLDVSTAEKRKEWTTMLVGGLRAGGRGYYALDISSPENFSEANADDIVMWEFTHEDDPDLGFSFSQPSIVRIDFLNDANDDDDTEVKWAVVFSSGYNNTLNDSNGVPQSGGKSKLFILKASGPGSDGVWEKGVDYFSLNTKHGSKDNPSGLATPAVVDNNQDGIADHVYAGNLKGQLFRFDLNVNPFAVANVDSDGKPQPIFTAVSDDGTVQPITMRPEVGRKKGAGFDDELMVYFGTGQYFENGDNSPTSQSTHQSFYAVWDKLDQGDATPAPAPTRANMLQQQITAEVDTTGQACGDTEACFRITTDNAFRDVDDGADLAHRGWYMDLYNQQLGSSQHKGERTTADPLLRQGRIIFSTLSPSKDPCAFGGGGWLMELNADDGGRLAQSPFDIDNNQIFNSSDTITYNSTPTIVGGIRSTVGIMATPTILGVAEQEYEFKILSGSAGTTSLLESAAGEFGRITWREIRRD